MEAIQVMALGAAITTAIPCYLSAVCRLPQPHGLRRLRQTNCLQIFSRFRPTLQPANGLSHHFGHLFLPEGWIRAGGKLRKSSEALRRRSRRWTASRPDLQLLTPMDGKLREVSPSSVLKAECQHGS